MKPKIMNRGRVRVSSSPIDILACHCEDVTLPCPPVELAELGTLAEVLGQVPDPRRIRGRGALLSLCLVAALGGTTSLAAIARFAADDGTDLRERLGLARSAPAAATLGPLLARLDGDALDDSVAPGSPTWPPTPSRTQGPNWSDWPWTARQDRTRLPHRRQHRAPAT
ncbi:transposase family protein [Streptomyces sp. NPDC002659]|uniref:transposase family protein n=1 Tax=Streptomyces sp. NPDC002659 TaxID=3364656 RepID=UPI003691CF75